MKAICDGTRTKGDVVYTNIEQYREVYVRAVQQLDMLQKVWALLRILTQCLHYNDSMHDILT